MTDHGLFDIHCHLIPGVDDGAQDLEETRRLLRMEYEQGVRNIIATPHYRDQMFDTSIRTIAASSLWWRNAYRNSIRSLLRKTD